MNKYIDRRKFLKNAGVAASAAFVLPRFSISKEKSPNSKINVACVGVGGVGSMTFGGIGDEANIVALCDVNKEKAAIGKKRYPEAKFFQDYREMLDKMGKDIDAVTVSTPDVSHFNIAMDSMQCGKHICVQKPLAHNIWEVRQMAKATHYYKVKSQMMNQGHSTTSIRMLKEWYDTGLCGKISEVHLISNGPNWNSIYFKKPLKLPLEAEETPSDLDWNLWLNRGKYTPFSSYYTPATWRTFWDYGTGMLGDWFCHTGDAPVWILDLKDPVSVEIIESDNNLDPKVIIPNSSTVKWTFPATEKHGELAMYWHDGGNKPKNAPKDINKDFKGIGMMMVGSGHTLSSGARPNINPRIGDSAFFAEFKRNLPAKTIRRVRKDNLYFDWLDAIKGEIPESSSNFDYASQLTEVALLGVLAQRFGEKIEWDGKNMMSPNRPELKDYINEPARKGWETSVIPS